MRSQLVICLCRTPCKFRKLANTFLGSITTKVLPNYDESNQTYKAMHLQYETLSKLYMPASNAIPIFPGHLHQLRRRRSNEAMAYGPNLVRSPVTFYFLYSVCFYIKRDSIAVRAFPRMAENVTMTCFCFLIHVCIFQ